MKFRVYGHIKDSKTSKVMTGVSIKLYLGEEELQKGKSAENGFYELIAEIDDSRIESGQQLSVTVEKEGFEKQEHRLLATEGSFNLDIKLETAAPPPPKPFNWLPVIIAGGAVILLLIIGIVVLLLLKPKPPRITSFTADPNSIELGQTATLRWKTKNAKSVEIEIDQNVVSLDSDGNRQVQPTQTTEYELIAKGKKGEKVTESQVVVVEDVAPPEVTITLSPSEPTSEEDVTFTASATDSGGISKIEILVNDTKVQECPDSPCTYKGGPYTLDSISYKVYAWDKSENKATVGPESIEIQDAGAPRVKITASPEIPNTKDKVAFTARASDSGGLSKVQIFVDETKVEECTGSPCKYLGGPYSLGKVSYEAYAWDKSGNKGSTGSKTIAIADAGAPRVKITASPETPNTKDKVTFTARASDPGGIRNVRIYVNGKKVKECTDTRCTFGGGPYSLGKVSYEAYAWDKSGNKGASGSKTIAIADIGPPRVTITASPKSPNTKDKVAFTASASDPGGIRKLQIFVNGKQVKECTDTRCILEGGPYPLGKVSYEANAWDKSGNKGTSGSKTISIADIGPPRVKITASPETPNTKDRVTFTASASDPGGIRNIQIYVNGKKVKECTDTRCIFGGGPYPLGKVSYEAYAWDKSGNKEASGAKIIEIADIGAPKVTITTTPKSPNTKDRITFTASASDPGGIRNVQIFVNKKKVKECTGARCTYGGGPYSNGKVSYEAFAWDRSGNKGVTGSKTLVLVDVVKPNVNITLNPIKPNTKQQVTFTATGSDSGGSGISKIDIFVNRKKMKSCSRSSSCAFRAGPYPFGNISYYATAYDKAGNSRSTGSRSVNIQDRTQPKVSIAHTPFTVNLKNRVTFNASASDTGIGINRIEIYVNGKQKSKCYNKKCSYKGGPYSYSHLTYYAIAYDKAGNKKSTSHKTLTVMNYNFETGNLDGWQRTSGTAFKNQPTYLDNTKSRGQVSSKLQGSFWIGTYEKYTKEMANRPIRSPLDVMARRPGQTQGDGPIGTLTSKYFYIQSSSAKFLMGGGKSRNLRVELRIRDTTVMKEYNSTSTEAMRRVTWDLSKYVGKKAQLRIVDNSTGGWGHINFDDFKFLRVKSGVGYKIWDYSPITPMPPIDSSVYKIMRTP